MREILDDRVREIDGRIIRMGEMVLESIDQAMQAFREQDAVLAGKVLENDRLINELDKEIEHLCVTLAATQSPLASDLRHMVSVLQIVTDLERVGDYSCNIAEIVRDLGSYRVKEPAGLREMEKKVRYMLDSSIKAFLLENEQFAYEIAAKDDVIDELRYRIHRDLLRDLKEREEDEGPIVGLILIIRHLERIADHATNICERLIFMKTGNTVKF
ncbi:phosphate signaling complex protein PhoU [Anaerotalea alkaliphila]|uniref:Phosphate-specific transport system accessory protein PhoU n=1 Tax=Anaerotalea alkaliphila TaxID=2662126 RepID=A0A7X5HTX3_9FIRM|nr:phosphate signaling complex protein PhoU [Anaerotalea alkaliphila]NDL66579.1 phosphate signaling complex protein PhoU [Anaerotalea alkaliphila]